MRTFFTLGVILSFLSATSLLALSSGNSIVFAVCSEITGPNVSCNEQHNTRSNIETNTSNTSTDEEEESPLLCSDLKCNLGEEYLLSPDISLEDSPFDLLDY